MSRTTVAHKWIDILFTYDQELRNWVTHLDWSSSPTGLVASPQRPKHRTKKKRNQQATREDGVVAVIVALVMVVLLLFIGLALDTSLARDRGSSLQLTADAAALAAASALPDLALAQTRAQEAVARNATGVTAIVAQTPGKPGQITVKVSGKSQSTFSKIVGINDYLITKSSYAEQSVGIAMGSPYNSIGTGDLPGMVPDNPTALQGYFLAINGPCTAKEDGDRFSALYEGTRGSKSASAGQNSHAYHCADDPNHPDGSVRSGALWTDCDWAMCTGTAKSQWKTNTENRPGGYSFLVDVPCDSPCTPTLADPVFVDAWDPWFRSWHNDPSATTLIGGPGCAAIGRSTGTARSCTVDKVPIADHDRNWAKYDQANEAAHTKFAIFKQQPDSSYVPYYAPPQLPFEDFGSIYGFWWSDWNFAGYNSNWVCDANPGARTEWTTIRRGGAAPAPYCKDWFSISHEPIREPGRYRIQVVADKQIYPPQTYTYGPGDIIQYDGGRSYSINTFSLRTRRRSQNAAAFDSATNTTGWQPCSTELTPNCVPITGEGALSVYVKTQGDSDLFLSKMAPAQDYRGRTIQIQLWDPGEGAKAIKILQPVAVTAADPTGWKSIPFKWSTADPGLADFTSGAVVQDRASTNGWVGSARVGVAAPAATGIDVSGTYASNTPPWATNERYGNDKFNGRLLLLDISIPADYGKDASGLDLPPAAYQGGWWKIRYETVLGGSVEVEDRTTWAVVSGGGPVHLVRE
jgi:Flp pilus assembly protein TadG